MRTKNVRIKKCFQILPKLTIVVGSDQAKKRFSVLIQILKYYKSPNQNVLELQIIPELKNGTEYSWIMALVWTVLVLSENTTCTEIR